MRNFLPTNTSLVWLKQVVRFTLIGLFNNSIGYLVYLVLTYLGAAPKLTMTGLYLLGACIAYLGNRHYTFSHAGNWQTSGWRYVVVYLLGYVINLSILLFMVDHWHYPHEWVQGVAIFIVAGFLFIAMKFFVFPSKPSFPGSV